MKKERSFERDSILYKLSVLDLKNNQTLGYLGDISKEGILIFSPKALISKENLLLRISLPPEDFSLPFFDITVEVHWSKPDVPRTDLFASGCLIVDGHQKFADIIEKLMEIYGFLKF